MIAQRRQRPLLLLSLPALLLIYFFLFTGRPDLSPSLSSSTLVSEEDGEFEGLLDNGHRIRQATMLYEGDKDKLRSVYERSLETHIKHGQRWGTPTHVLKRNLVEEGSYFNKPAFLASLIMREMAKPKAGRADWIVWFDGDSIIMNPEIPWSTFLPPEDFPDVHILASQDDNGFNAGMLLLRVHEWTVQAMSEAVALHQLKPDVDLEFYDQSAIEYVCSRPGYEEHFLYQPRKWWNRYFFDADGNEAGELVLHFAGVGWEGGGSSEKARCMNDYLEKAKLTQDWTRPLSQTSYPTETDEFWKNLRLARDLLKRTQTRKETNSGGDVDGIISAENDLRHIMLKQADQKNKLLAAITQLEVHI